MKIDRCNDRPAILSLEGPQLLARMASRPGLTSRKKECHSGKPMGSKTVSPH
jgi:hypothetical protein